MGDYQYKCTDIASSGGFRVKERGGSIGVAAKDDKQSRQSFKFVVGVVLVLQQRGSKNRMDDRPCA